MNNPFNIGLLGALFFLVIVVILMFIASNDVVGAPLPPDNSVQTIVPVDVVSGQNRNSPQCELLMQTNQQLLWLILGEGLIFNFYLDLHTDLPITELGYNAQFVREGLDELARMTQAAREMGCIQLIPE